MNLHLKKVRLAISDFTLEIDAVLDRAITGIFGPSGSGKTSLLELISGLRRPDKGVIKLDDTILSDTNTSMNLPPRSRRIGYVPQDLALFPHLNVRANLLYGYRPPTKASEPFTFEHVVAVMEIASLLDRRVTTLSGGEQQRVAFARAILSAPRLLLLDEPMSSLDSRLKRRLIPFLLRIQDEFHLPLIYVSHDAGELASLCEEVVALDHGQITGRGTPSEILPAPQS